MLSLAVLLVVRPAGYWLSVSNSEEASCHQRGSFAVVLDCQGVFICSCLPVGGAQNLINRHAFQSDQNRTASDKILHMRAHPELSFPWFDLPSTATHSFRERRV